MYLEIMKNTYRNSVLRLGSISIATKMNQWN